MGIGIDERHKTRNGSVTSPVSKLKTPLSEMSTSYTGSLCNLQPLLTTPTRGVEVTQTRLELFSLHLLKHGGSRFLLAF